jgi:hypothetical protein
MDTCNEIVLKTCQLFGESRPWVASSTLQTNPSPLPAPTADWSPSEAESRGRTWPLHCAEPEINCRYLLKLCLVDPSYFFSPRRRARPPLRAQPTCWSSCWRQTCWKAKKIKGTLKNSLNLSLAPDHWVTKLGGEMWRFWGNFDISLEISTDPIRKCRKVQFF